MSTNVYWRPEAPRKGECLDKGVKRLLQKRYDLHGDGMVFDEADVSYLEGLADAADGDTERDLRTLIDAIRTHGEIRVWTQG